MSAPLSDRTAGWRALARPGTLVALDFDGTLARLVGDRRSARLSRATRAALARVAARYPVAILSGRAAADVSSRLDGIPVRWVIGNHGAEWPGSRRRGWRRRVATWRRLLASRLRGAAGIDVEDKGLSLAVHWRAAPSARAGRLAAEAAAELPRARAVPGKKVLNLLPVEAGDKGTALRRLAATAGAARLLFVGDDATDEDAFRADLPVPAVTVRVGPSRASAARYHVATRAGVDDLLRRLALLREPPAPARRRPPGRRGPRKGERPRGSPPPGGAPAATSAPPSPARRRC